ncbi:MULTISPECIES: hypothetical protein [Serratia]|uniref:hypothetical protein n=1 Tax=Serratia TaxID=613 RepID=UPI0028BE9EAE|nr:hypothetical protein [Serratia sp. (in: enterobacteria)]
MDNQKLTKKFIGTPGPWNISFHGSENCWVVDSENDHAIAKVTCYRKDGDTQRANFKLIAAAPDILIALQDFLSVAENELRGLSVIQPEVKQAKAAISKAIWGNIE